MIYQTFIRILLRATMMLGLLVGPAIAQNPTILQVTPNSQQSGTIEFDIEALDGLPQLEFVTTTIWTDGEIVFSGVPLKALLDRVEAKGTILEMVALNDYAVTMPISDIEDMSPMIATRMNGELMSVRDKGPFWIVFPYDSDPKYQIETVYSRSIWQLNRLIVWE